MLTFNPKEVETLLKNAVSECFSLTERFANETIFKYELYHQLAKRKICGVGLVEKLEDSNTCILHAEAKAFNGQTCYLKKRGIERHKKADLLLCNPRDRNSSCQEFGQYNYKPEVIIELKKKYVASEARKLIMDYEKYLKYFSFTGRFYLIYANKCRVDKNYIRSLEIEFQLPVEVKIISRDDFGKYTYSPDNQSISVTGEEELFGCMEKALKLHGNSWDQTKQAFYWRNCQQEGELKKKHTFPCEGDFNSQLYHQLRKRSKFGSIQAEYNIQQGRVDLVVRTRSKKFFVEIKMNWNQFRKGCEPPTKIANKFLLIEQKYKGKPIEKIVLVIQGNPHRKSNMLGALTEFNKQPFTIIRYSETLKKMEVYEPTDSWDLLFDLTS